MQKATQETKRFPNPERLVVSLVTPKRFVTPLCTAWLDFTSTVRLQRLLRETRNMSHLVPPGPKWNGIHIQVKVELLAWEPTHIFSRLGAPKIPTHRPFPTTNCITHSNYAHTGQPSAPQRQTVRSKVIYANVFLGIRTS